MVIAAERASLPEASERSSSLMCAERGFWTKFYLAHGIVVVRACYAQNTNFKLAKSSNFYRITKAFSSLMLRLYF
jgi:hypothetical protein